MNTYPHIETEISKTNSALAGFIIIIFTLLCKLVALINELALIFGTGYIWYTEGFLEASRFAGIFIASLIGIKLLFSVSGVKNLRTLIRTLFRFGGFSCVLALFYWHINIFFLSYL